MRIPLRLLLPVIAGALVIGACAPLISPNGVTAADPARASSGRYLVLLENSQVPVGFLDRVVEVGGSVETAIYEIGVAVVTGLDPVSAAELAAAAGVQDVVPDPVLSGQADRGDTGNRASRPVEVASRDTTSVAGEPWDAKYYPWQWNMQAVFAHKAWRAGHLGSRGVVVAMLDTGIDDQHPDLKGLVDPKRSRSFVPEENVADYYPGRPAYTDLYYHGTAVAALVGSNAKVIAGVNQHVTLLAVKIADRMNAGSVGRMIAGIVYAASVGADVISISRWHDIDKRKDPATATAFELAALYARARGALIVTVSVNDGADLDNNGDIVRYPCEAYGVICTSATAPTSAEEEPDGLDGPWENIDARATNVNLMVNPYSAFGAAVDVAAPGGSLVRNPGAPPPFLPTVVWVPCTTTPTDSSPLRCRNGEPLFPGVGTSWAAPHVAGLAALLVAQLGHNRPALVSDRILRTADDVEPYEGIDPYYGHGRINIRCALGLVP